MSLQPLPVALAAALAAFTLVYTLTPLWARHLKERGFVVEDVHKPGRPLVPRPGGPVMLLGFIAAEALLYLASGDIRVLAVILTVAIAGLIGLVDDLLRLPGPAKPLLLVGASLPLLLLGAYSYRPEFPLYGPVRISIVYPILLLASMPIVANTFNSLDVVNGAVSGFTVVVSVPIAVAMVMKGDQAALAATLPLVAVSLAFYRWHKYPARVFPGDSGSLMLGAAYAALTVIGSVEVVGVVALLPAILNSFLFLSSVKALVEHRELKVKPTHLLDNGRIAANRDPRAPVTLLRLLTASRPLSEQEVSLSLILLAAYSSLLAIITAYLTWGI
jgi:UDP-N-acetylglucosamine--dolichyl-phosphate N-acetylglucosaminephosphotransferase